MTILEMFILSVAAGMDPVMVEFSDVCRHFLGKGGEYLAVGFSVVVLLGGIMVYWVLMSNFLYYTGTVVYGRNGDSVFSSV